MSRPFLPKRNRHVQNDVLYSHKIKPTFPLFKQQEFLAASPCKKCFSSTSSDQTSVCEKLGVQNQLEGDLVLACDKKNVITCSQILMEHFQSLQIHRGQIEIISQHDLRNKVFVTKLETPWDQAILAYFILSVLKEDPAFLNSLPQTDTILQDYFQTVKLSGLGHSEVLFLNLDTSDDHLQNMYNRVKLRDDLDIHFIPVSFSYEFLPSLALTASPRKRKPVVRINFGLPHSFLDFINQKENQSNMLTDLKKHLLHEIWKNTSVMSVHVVSMFLHHRKDFLISDCVGLMKEFEKEFRHSFDLAFIGEMENVTKYSLNLVSASERILPSMAADLMKHESIMMKSLLLVMDLTLVDHQYEIFKISQNALLEKFRGMTKILHHDIECIYPPCSDFATIEKETLDGFFQHSVFSQQSDETTSEEQQLAKRMARHLDLEDEDDDDSCWPFVTPVNQDISLFVNIETTLSRKWIAEISNTLLETYYVAARQLLKLREVDVMEEAVFLANITAVMNETFAKNNQVFYVEDLKKTVSNALKLFEEEGIIESYQHCGVRVIYLKDPLVDDNLLVLIRDIAQFIC